MYTEVETEIGRTCNIDTLLIDSYNVFHHVAKLMGLIRNLCNKREEYPQFSPLNGLWFV